jgi:hypothetical protein
MVPTSQAEAGGLRFEDSLYKISETPSKKQSRGDKGMAQVVEHKALGSIPSTRKK